jgi:hypothetical protein
MAYGQVPDEVAIVLVNQADGSTSMVLHNNSSHTVTAVIFTADLYQKIGSRMGVAGTWRCLDSRANSWRALPPGDSRQIGGGRPGTVPVAQLRAALFDDGTAFGDPVWSQRILQRRGALAQVLGAILIRMDQALADSSLIAGMIAQCQATMDASKAQRPLPGGPNNWPNEMVNDANQLTVSWNKFVIDNVIGTARQSASQTPAENLTVISTYLHHLMDRLNGLGN